MVRLVRQDLSIAGKRSGLDGERSGLFMEQIRIIKEMRENERRNGRTDESIRPRYMVWENVPGAFSSNGGEDFRIVLEETAKVADPDAVIPRPEGKWSPSGCILGNGWSIAWRVHDAQHWGVPQRRKRICLLADFNGDTAGKILFELRRETANGDTKQTVADFGEQSRSEVLSQRKSVCRNSEPGEEKRETTAGTTGESVKGTIAADLYNGTITDDVARTLNAVATDSTHVPCVIFSSQKNDGENVNSQTVFDARGNGGRGG